MSHGDLSPDRSAAAAVAPLDPPAAVAAHPAVQRAAQLACDVLAPTAEQVDAGGGVTRDRVDLVARAGLLGLAAPPADGGEGASADVVRAVTEELAGACASTWFVTTQHGMPLQYALRTENAALRGRLLPAMGRGDLLAGVAVSHLRRRGTPAVRARRDGEGWVVDGTVGWFTGWGLADVLLLGAVTEDGRALFAFLPATEQPGLTPGGPMPLAAMQATGTTTLRLEGLRLPDADVADITPLEAWLEVDAAKSANVTPAVFGLLRTVVRRLAAWAEKTGSSEGLELAAALAAEGGGLRSQAYSLIDDVPAESAVEDRLALRAAALELLNRAAAALVVSGAGMSMSATSPNQRLAREALFMLVQAQTAPVRSALLRRYTDLAPALPGLPA